MSVDGPAAGPCAPVGAASRLRSFGFDSALPRAPSAAAAARDEMVKALTPEEIESARALEAARETAGE